MQKPRLRMQVRSHRHAVLSVGSKQASQSQMPSRNKTHPPQHPSHQDTVSSWAAGLGRDGNTDSALPSVPPAAAIRVLLAQHSAGSTMQEHSSHITFLLMDTEVMRCFLLCLL